LSFFSFYASEGVKEASERAILKLRTLQNQYVSAVRKASNTEGEKHPDTRLFRSSDLLHPFLLAANYPNASPKLLDTSFKAMKSLMEADAICPGDGMNMVRVWMIQAQVVVSYSKNVSTSNIKDNLAGASGAASASFIPNDTTIRNSTSSDTKISDATSSTTPSTSSWFGGYFSSTSSSASNNNPAHTSATSAAASAAAAASSTIAKMTISVTTKTAVSSSHGQAGLGNLNAKDLEKIALDILSCLLQLLRLKDLPVSTEQWIQSVTLCCLLYLPQLRQNVQQAARSTLPQVLTLLLQDEKASQLFVKTWDDLLTCSLGFSSTSTTEKGKLPSLQGSFSHCRLGEKDSPQPPSPSFSLELMATLLSESPDTFFASVGPKTFGVIVQVLQNQSKVLSNAIPVDFLKALQFSLIILQTQGADYPLECRELIVRLIQPVSLATEALRKQADFEDGYIYKVPIVKQLSGSGAVGNVNNGPSIANSAQTSSSKSATSTQGPTAITMPNQNIETLQGLPPTVLWKAALSMETLKAFIYHDSSKKRSSTSTAADSNGVDSSQKHTNISSTFRSRDLWLHEDVIGQLLEATSDFCTIGASCEEHMILLILACRALPSETIKSLSYSAETLDSIEQWQKGKNNDNAYVLGEALWAGLNVLLKMIDQLEDTVLEQAFAPSLSVLQHYLKRFPASGTIVKRSLEGYFSLAKVSLNLPLFRRALLASLCKLSLPQWGSNDSSTKLRDHNIAALICLLNIVHRHYDNIGPEWSLVLQTFDELSAVSIASPHLSNSAYVGALSVSAVYGRFASFSTCLSDEAIFHFITGLKDVAIVEKPVSTIPSPLDGEDIQVPDKPTSGTSQDDRSTISGKLINMGARAIAWNNDSNSQEEDLPVAERTKNTYYDDYQMDFMNRLSASKHQIRNRQVPFSVALLADAAMANSHRQGQSCAKIFHQFCTLAAESSSVRLFLVDMLTMLTMNHISNDLSYPVSFIGPGKIMYADPRQNQYLAVEKAKRGDPQQPAPSQDGRSQLDLLGPLCGSISNSKVAEMAEAGLEALYSVLESTGHRLVSAAWIEVIGAIASAASGNRSSEEWSTSCQVGFRCLKLIVDDFLEDAASAAQTELLDCCSAFGSSRQDVNTSLTAIGLLWSIADQDTSTESVDRALAKLVLLSCDTRPEVRNCAVNTLFSCIVGRGSTFSDSQWEKCMFNTIFAVYDAVTSDVSEDSVPQAQKSTKKSRYTVAVHHTRDSTDKQWLTTQALVLSGLCRLLRNFFSKLLNTTDQGSSPNQAMEETPWFDGAWSKILGYAFEASTQEGGRDTIELRTSGVELLVLCNQLSCAAGIQAAISPARVGTNMEVVNGALRSVRSPDKSDGESSLRHSHSAVTEMWRENLFLDAFDVLDSFQDHLNEDSASEKKSINQADPTQIQVLTKLAQELAKLYDCCKDAEFAEDKSLSNVDDFEALFVPILKPPTEKDAMATRFVRVVTTVASRSSSGADARFLSQAQRSCMDLLKRMATDGSPEGLLSLTAMAGPAFFYEKETDGKPKKTVNILSHEASSALLTAFPSDQISDECKVLTLAQLLSIFLKQDSAKSKVKIALSYKDLVAILKEGLKSLTRKSNDSTGPMSDLFRGLWERICSSLSQMLSPSSDSSQWQAGIPHAADLVDIVDSVSENAPSIVEPDLSAIFTSGASWSFDAASGLKPASDPRVDEALGLFAACFGGVCRVRPSDAAMQDIARNILTSAATALSASANAEDSVEVKAARKICEVLSSFEDMEDFVISIFPALARLVGVEESSIRRRAGEVLATCRINDVVMNARRQQREAEERAARAESRVLELESTVERLQREKEALENQHLSML
jgi:C-terminal region of Mon2 protein